MILEIYNGNLIDTLKIVSISKPQLDSLFRTPIYSRTCSFTILFNGGAELICKRNFSKWYQGFPHFINKDDDPTKQTEMVWNCNDQKHYYRLIDGSLVDTDIFRDNEAEKLLCFQNLKNEYDKLILLWCV